MTAKIVVLYSDTAEPLITINRASGYKQFPGSPLTLTKVLADWTKQLEKMGYIVEVEYK
jgi:hypothetical protein